MTKTTGWTGRTVDSPMHPWTDNHGHEHAQRIASRIASDLITHRRWESGANDPLPTYDPADGHYVGDSAVSDTVRCQAHLLRIHQPAYIWDGLARSRRPFHEVSESMAEVAYRAYFAAELVQAAALRDELDAMMADGRVERDEHPLRAVRRLVAARYTVDRLRAEVG